MAIPILLLLILSFILPGPSSAQLQSGQFQEYDYQSYFVSKHNDYRSRRLPYPATNMKGLTWSTRMATEAEMWARTCQFKHYTNGYGQNLYMMGGRGAVDKTLIHNAMESWGQKEMVGDMKIVHARGPVYKGREMGQNIYDHYTQIVWASTREVGCAYAHCPTMRYIVCNYYPAGNMMGRGWYEVGDTCTKCAKGEYCSNGLCVRGVPPTPKPTTPAPTPAPTTLAPTPAPTTMDPQISAEDDASSGNGTFSGVSGSYDQDADSPAGETLQPGLIHILNGGNSTTKSSDSTSNRKILMSSIVAVIASLPMFIIH